MTAIYFNPLNDAPSLHKYDARNYRHIDRNFGPDPRGDEAIMSRETPDDPSTWQWTASDSLFLGLLENLHERGMRAVMDYSWNHTGVSFWAWQDVLENQATSPYADWYDVERYDDPDTPENEFSYRGWAGVSSLPGFRKVGIPDGFHGGPAEGDLNDGAKAHILAVTHRWMDPNSDGDPSDGVDGFRLDVAEQIPLGFWRDYRRFVKSINPDAFLVGEIWWEQWPERMMDPRPYLDNVFDAVMNYRWYMPVRSLITGAPPGLTPSTFVAHMDSLEAGIPEATLQAMMNVAATHDSPRLSTSLYNSGPYKYGANPRDNPAYRIDRPDSLSELLKRMLLVQQFTYRGAPHIWYGDEVGMWGADDPDTRKPMVWSDYEYEREVLQPTGKTRLADTVRPDTALAGFYRSLAEMRRSRPDALALGGIDYWLVDDAAGLLGYQRTSEKDTLVVVLNLSDGWRSVELPPPPGYRLKLATREGVDLIDGNKLTLAARSAAVLFLEE